MNHEEISAYLHSLADTAIASHSQRFFKTAQGEYGYGDRFLGIRVPVLRQAVKKFKTTPISTAKQLLRSDYHEIRLFALLLLVYKFSQADIDAQTAIYNLYLANTKHINNWDLVDSSAHYILGAYLYNRDRAVLDDLAKSRSLWERRIAIIATYHFIRNGQYQDTLRLSAQLLNDQADLIHKAVGWMLREVGNRDRAVEVRFLKAHYKQMPRTMLRYAIEKFSLTERRKYLNSKV